MQSKREIRERRRKRRRRQRLTTILIVSGVALIIVAVLMLPTVQRSLKSAEGIVVPELSHPPMAQGNAMGDPDAPVVIEDYSDFGCPHCANFATDTGKKIAENYVADGKVYFVFHGVGSMLNATISPKLMQAAYCAGDQNQFWEYHDLIFANQNTLYANPNLPLDKYITSFAQELNLDQSAFQQCYDSGKYADQVRQDEIDARQAGVNSTPSFLINGQLVVGNRPYSEFQSIIEAELSQ